MLGMSQGAEREGPELEEPDAKLGLGRTADGQRRERGIPRYELLAFRCLCFPIGIERVKEHRHGMGNARRNLGNRAILRRQRSGDAHFRLGTVIFFATAARSPAARRRRLGDLSDGTGSASSGHRQERNRHPKLNKAGNPSLHATKTI